MTVLQQNTGSKATLKHSLIHSSNYYHKETARADLVTSKTVQRFVQVVVEVSSS